MAKGYEALGNKKVARLFLGSVPSGPIRSEANLTTKKVASTLSRLKS